MSVSMKIVIAAAQSTVVEAVRDAYSRWEGAAVPTFATVTNTARALTEAADAEALLLDWEDRAPDQNLEWIGALRARYEQLPIFMLCPRALAGTTLSGLKAGASGILAKPIRPEELIAAVTKAAAAAAKAKSRVDVDFLNPFVDGCKSVFSTMCGMEVERKRIYLRDDNKMLGDVSALMGLSGTAQGNMVISLPKSLACRAVANMLGESPGAEVNQDIADGVGEILNMIAGYAKAALVKTPYHFTISLPAVVIGYGHEIIHRGGLPNIVVIFAVEGEEFALQVCLSPGTPPS